MSIYGAMFTGISSLTAYGRALAATSNNISNVNTVGYKTELSRFSTLLTGLGTTTEFSAGGVRAVKQQAIDQQGLLQTSSRPTDLAINGNGFFVVTLGNNADGNDELLFTRAGAFSPDGDGYLRNSAGYYLQGWRLDSNGALPANRNELEPINFNDLVGTAEATTEMAPSANLQASQTAFAGTYAPGTVANNMASGNVAPHIERTVEIYDTQGGAQPLRLSFLKTSANTWAYEVSYDGPAANITTATNLPIGSGNLTFNADGTLATPVGGTATLTIPFSAASGLATQTITMNFGTPGQPEGVTQFDSPSNLISSGANGALFGSLTGLEFNELGKVIAQFDNGVQREVYQLPIAKFPNPNGLFTTSGNAFRISDESGEVSLIEANSGGAGTIAANSLESSTIDLAKEFTDLITTQRAYSAGTRIITTADEMLQELVQILR